MELKRKISSLELAVAVEKSKRANLLAEISAALVSSDDEDKPVAVEQPVAVVPAGVDITFDYTDDEECGWCGVTDNPCLCEQGLVCGGTALPTDSCPCLDCCPECKKESESGK